MKLTKTTTNFLAMGLFACVYTVNGQTPAYKNPQLPPETRAKDLLARMSTEEKAFLLTIRPDTNQMGDKSCSMLGFLNNSLPPREAALEYNKMIEYMKNKTRWGIPGLRAGEGIFAYMGFGSTAFPVPLAQASAWDATLVRSVAGVISEEVKSRGVRNILSPVLNIARDPRWGRTGETYGEDPLLISDMGVAFVQTFENKGIATTLKHFAGNTGHDGKFGAAVFYSERYYREYEFPPYEACIKKGRAQGIMMSYNTGDAVPFVQNAWMMNQYLKKELGFSGVIMSDGGGLALVKEAFGIDSTDAMVTAKAINAGCDIGLDNYKYYYDGLLKAMQMGLVSEATLNEAALRMLTVIFKTGLYDHPYAHPEYAEKINDCQAHRMVAREVARKTQILLKNHNSTLPFSTDIKKVLVTGPLANKLLINHYGGWGRKEVTVLEGIKNLLPRAQVTYSKGAEVGYTFFPTMNNVFFHTENGKNIPGLKGEYFANNEWGGTPVYVKTDQKIDFEWGENAPDKLPKDHFSVRWTGFFKAPYTGLFTFGAHADDGLTVYIDDSLVVDMRYGTRNALFVAKGNLFLEKGKTYRIRAEYKENGSNAYCQLGWDADIFAQIPQAVEQAKKADVIVAVVGMYDDENGDRANLNLDEAQEQLILELSKLNKPMVVVLQSANVITMRRWVHKVPAILQAWYPGEEGGNAIAETIFGYHNPSGKLPITIPLETGQVPITYNAFPGKDTKPVDRGLDVFWDAGNKPLFEFGFGLSYTTFSLSGITLSNTKITANDSITVKVKVTNTGKREGEEVVQLYTHQPYASVSRPVKELKAYKKVFLNAGESKTIDLTLKGEQLMFYNAQMKKVFEPGKVKIMIGNSADNIVFEGYAAAN